MAVLLGGFFLSLYYDRKKPRFISLLCCGILFAGSIIGALLFPASRETILSSSTENLLIVKREIASGKATLYRRGPLFFARPHEQFPYTVYGDMKTQWLQEDVCAITYVSCLLYTSIASAFAGEVYGLVPLERDISDSMENFTRFFVLSRQSGIAEGADKASLLFTLNHVSGSLAKVLSVFGEKGYNWTKIESRPILGRNWEYKFYVDVEGDIARLSEDMAQIDVYKRQYPYPGGFPRERGR